ncbi:MAG: hypothetical protein U5L45_09385 [Saprospiraceae bacterium]|nr:hypothetical protein [Saprospiraceae bacterium]
MFFGLCPKNKLHLPFLRAKRTHGLSNYFILILKQRMKKNIIIFSFFLILAATACDTSSKTSTTTVVAAAPQTQTVATPAAVSDSIADYQVKKFQAKKVMKAKSLEMAPPQKTVATPVPVRQ